MATKNVDIEAISTQIGMDVAKTVAKALTEERQRVHAALIENFFGSTMRGNFPKLSDSELVMIFRKIAYNEQPH